MLCISQIFYGFSILLFTAPPDVLTTFEFCYAVSDTEVSCYVTIENVTPADAQFECPFGTSLAYIENSEEFNRAFEYMTNCENLKYLLTRIYT